MRHEQEYISLRKPDDFRIGFILDYCAILVGETPTRGSKMITKY
jgi:hypothetical protein